jgi:hypothetical protein
MNQPTINNVNCKYGAPMGRAEWHGIPLPKAIRVFHVPLSQGYDKGGAYWGCGQALYCATDCEGYREFVRANSRNHAINQLSINNNLLKRIIK